MAIDLHKEEVLPGTALRWPRLDPAQVEARRREDLDDITERADPVANAEAKRSSIVAGRLLAGLAADHEEAGEIAARILNILGQNAQSVALGGRARRDRGGARLSRGQLGRADVACSVG